MTHTVLLVEDEVDLREMMQEALEFSGYAVVNASDGQEALDRLAGIERLCLVLLDLIMPGMNGWDFYDQLRQRSKFAEVPVIIHSSAPTRTPQGVARVLKKPIEFKQLLAVVQEYCGGPGPDPDPPIAKLR